MQDQFKSLPKVDSSLRRIIVFCVSLMVSLIVTLQMSCRSKGTIHLILKNPPALDIFKSAYSSTPIIMLKEDSDAQQSFDLFFRNEAFQKNVNEAAIPKKCAEILDFASSNEAIVLNSSMSISDISGGCRVSFLSNPNASGSLFLIFMSKKNPEDKLEIPVTVEAINDPPVISDVPNQVTNEGSSLTGVAVDISDLETVLDCNAITSTSSNTTLLPSENITIYGTAPNCLVRMSPALNQIGSSTITLTVFDGSLTAMDTYNLVVNDRPPASLAYSGLPYVYVQSVDITTQTPTLTGGTPRNCTITPSLPTGLSLNSSTCALSGKPTIADAARNYTVTATNTGGSTNTIIAIEVKPDFPVFGISAESGTNSQVALSWQAPDAPATLAQTLSAYKIYRSPTSSFTPSAGNLLTTVYSPTTAYTDSTVSNGTRYCYKIVAVYTDKESPASVEACALPLDPISTVQDPTNLFVSPGGNDTTGNGSIGNPYLTITKAQTTLNLNGTIFLKDGYYTAMPTFSKSLTLQSMTGDYRTSDAVISQ